MEWESILSVLKWIALVFAAGLIGYFGKHFGKMIVARFFSSHQKHQQAAGLSSNSSLEGAAPPAHEEDREADTTQYDKKAAKSISKLEKKRIKAEKKKIKKAE